MEEVETRFNRQKRSKSSSRMSYKTDESHVEFDIDVSLWGRKVGGFLTVETSTGSVRLQNEASLAARLCRRRFGCE